MRVRTYGLLLLGAIGIAPLALYGYLGIERSQRTNIDSVREGNTHLAQAIAEVVRQHIEKQHALLAALGQATLLAADPEQAFSAFELDDTYAPLTNRAVYKVRVGAAELIVGAPPADRKPAYDELVKQILADAELAVPTVVERADYGHIVTMANPIVIAGTTLGVIVAQYQFQGIWQELEWVSVGGSEYARLVSEHNQTIAHGNPDIRGVAFRAQEDAAPQLLRAAANHEVTENFRGQKIVVASAMISDRTDRSKCWQAISSPQDEASRKTAAAFEQRPRCWWVLVEQSAEDAFAATNAMKRDLLLVGASVLVLVLGIGLLSGNRLVSALERLRTHTRDLSTDLTSRLSFKSRLIELQELADSLDDMAKDLLSERDEAKRRERLTTFARVAAGLAHDLRLPVEAVRGACYMVNQADIDDPAHAFLRKVSERELPRLKRFVDDLQRLAQSGEIGLETEIVEPAELIEDVHAELSVAPKWDGVGFRTCGKALPIQIDRSLVRRAVSNLVHNAADACLQDGTGNQVTIEVADTNDTAVLEIRVVDNGVGVTPAQLKKLETGDFESTKRSTGVGLGLGVVRQVVAAHRGQLIVESTFGEGSTFVLRLPRKPVANITTHEET